MTIIIYIFITLPLSDSQSATSHIFNKRVEYTVNQHGAEDESEEVKTKESDIRNLIPEQTQNGESAVEVRTDKEHIERFVDTEIDKRVINRHVESEGDSGHYYEDERAAKEKALTVSVSVSHSEKYAHQDLRAVVNHGLNIDTHSLHEHVVRIAKYCQSRKKREGHHISHAAVAQLIVSCKGYDRQNVERRGAELEREDVPRVIPGESAIIELYAVYQLLIYFKQKYYYPNYAAYTSHRSVGAILKELTGDKGDDSRRDDARYVIRAEGGRLDHLRIKKIIQIL